LLYFEPTAAGSGIPEVKAYLNGKINRQKRERERRREREEGEEKEEGRRERKGKREREKVCSQSQ
jgi:hypothetical protein